LKTIIKCRGWLESVSDHKSPIPVNKDGTVNYSGYNERLEKVYSEKIERDLTKIF